MTDPIIVQKYGGSSVADVAALQQVAAAVVARARRGYRLVVVVSAMGRSTDELLALGQRVGDGQPLPQREVDLLVTAGERISMALLSMAICALGMPAQSFTGSQSGIITEARHGGARLLAVRPQRLEDALSSGAIVICAGYQGVSTTGEVTTLGRGGSDLTAVALAAALKAQSCEIYSDVDGVYSADPRLCPQARLLAQIPYEPLAALAAAGARVLHADAVRFAQAAGIAVLARRSHGAPMAAPRQTRLDAVALRQPGVVALTHVSTALLLRGAVATLWPKLQQLPCVGAAPQPLWRDGDVLLVHDLTDVAATARAAADYGASSTQVGVVTLVGSDLLRRVADRLGDCLGPRFPPASWSLFGHPGALHLVVAPQRALPALRRLHAQLVEG